MNKNLLRCVFFVSFRAGRISHVVAMTVFHSRRNYSKQTWHYLLPFQHSSCKKT